MSAAVPSVVWAWLVARSVVPHVGAGNVAVALCLAAMIAPTTALAALAALGRTPVSLREASFALGATPWQVAWRAVVPAARRELAAPTSPAGTAASASREESTTRDEGVDRCARASHAPSATPTGTATRSATPTPQSDPFRRNAVASRRGFAP